MARSGVKGMESVGVAVGAKVTGTGRLRYGVGKLVRNDGDVVGTEDEVTAVVE